jgi:hypothetical protein
MRSTAIRAGIVKVNALKMLGVTVLMTVFAAGTVLADEGVVERTNVCRTGTLIIKTTDDTYVAAIQEGLDTFDHTPWTDDDNPRCAFFAGDSVQGDLSGAGTVTLTNGSGKACDYVIEGSGFSMQDAEQILGCE